MTQGDGDSADTSCRKTPSRAVVEAVADAEGVPPEDVRPPQYESLHSIIDPEALDALFATRADGTPRTGGNVSFTFCNYHVTVDGTGSVSLEGRSAD